MFHGHLSVSPAFSWKAVDICERSEPLRPPACLQFRVSLSHVDCLEEASPSIQSSGIWLLLQSEQLLAQPCSLYICENSHQPESPGTGPSDLLPHLGLVFVLPCLTCLAPLPLCALLLPLRYPVQPLAFKLFMPANRKSAGLKFIFAVCIWLPARRCFWLCCGYWLDHGT